jgi:hypothetical protein
MQKKALLAQKISRINVKRNNGDIYVYERITKYNLAVCRVQTSPQKFYKVLYYL